MIGYLFCVIVIILLAVYFFLPEEEPLEVYQGSRLTVLGQELTVYAYSLSYDGKDEMRATIELVKL